VLLFIQFAIIGEHDLIKKTIFQHFIAYGELILLKSERHEMQSTYILQRLEIILNRKYDDTQNFISRTTFFIRRILNLKRESRALNLSSSMRGELEIQIYKKKYLEDKFVDRDIILYSILFFINGFDFFRNMYRSLISWYLILVALNLKNRNRRTNVFVLTLDSYDFNFSNVVAAVESRLIALDRRINIIIKNKRFFVYVFNLDFIEDMLQQLNNRELLRQNATHDYNYCLISFNARNKVYYDTIKNEQYYY